MVTLFHDMMHKEIEVYVDDMIAKSRQGEDHVGVLQKLFKRLRKFKLRLNPTKCVFGTRLGKLLGFMVSNKGIEIDPSKVKAICDLRAPITTKEVRSLMGRLNYVARFIYQLFETSKPFFKLLKKNAKIEWDIECQGCDNTRFHHRILLVTENDPIRYLLEKPALVGKLAKWQILISEFDIQSLGQKSVKGRAIVDMLAESPEWSRTFDEDSDAGEQILLVSSDKWTMYFDGAVNLVKSECLGRSYLPRRCPAYCMTIEEEPDGQPWYHDILKYLQNDYFTKWIEANSYVNVTAKNVAKFIRRDIVARYGVPEAIITDNGTNLNNKVVDGLFSEFRIKHLNSSPYRPQMNGAVEAANKNIKKILSKTAENYHDWHDRLPYALMAYRTSICTSTGATPFSLVYGMEAVLPVEVEVPSLRVLSQSMLDETEWMQQRHEQSNLIDEKRLQAVCHGQCYQRRVAKAFNRRVRPRYFEVNDQC
ncbi:uncharacterized protein K02A2.6-like [Eucalyptus grandis]|uniref:uncharacterized protein K02A2.6-like n=1 Tax=Eucalyptus grandis TaxID=71139 RepID=UPI00192EB684|nr:uncharacterized protein K02A2.6-like [Eucalyptus grandis]